MNAEIQLDEQQARLVCSGVWTIAAIEQIESKLAQTNWPTLPNLSVDMHNVQRMDSAGAWLLYRTLIDLGRPQEQQNFVGLKPDHRALLDLVAKHFDQCQHTPQPLCVPNPLAILGEQTVKQFSEMHSFITFLGETTVYTVQALLHPFKIRWNAVMNNLDHAGLRALPIVGLMSFLIGIVLAYQAGSQLRLYGANIFIVDLVSITLLRELGPLLTAIMVAGRTGSAFTAQIATMKITDEIDALRTIGIPPMNLLVVPKMLALMFIMPLLSVFADIAGIFGGMLIAKVSLNVSFYDFLHRLQNDISALHFYLGLLKAPVFAAVIVMVGCYQGLKVSGGADSVGKQVTISVVQSIFLVIVIDAIFSIVFNWLGL